MIGGQRQRYGQEFCGNGQQQQQPQQQHHSREREHGGPLQASQRVLLVVLRSLTAPIPLDKMFSIFSQFGVVEKQSTFLTNNQHQLVVQFADSADANSAMGYLNGRTVEMRDGESVAMCTLAIVPSRLTKLTFRKDDDRNKDYSWVNTRLGGVWPLLQEGAEFGELAGVFEQLQLPLTDFLWGRHISGAGWLFPPQPDAAQRGTIPFSRGLPTGKMGECVHLAGLPTSGINALKLWALCGQYGELIAVKLLAQHPGCALLQFTTQEEAAFAIKNLNNAVVYGTKIFAQVSKNANATHWKGAQTELEQRMCTKEDYAPPAPAPRHITAPPNRFVGAWGLPAHDAVNAILAVLSGHNVVSCQDYGHGVVSVTFDTPEEALEAIGAVNGAIAYHHGQKFKVCVHFADEDWLDSAHDISSSSVADTPSYSSVPLSGQSSLQGTPNQLPTSNPPLSPQQQRQLAPSYAPQWWQDRPSDNYKIR
ncbi:Polypyrimidine tract-binding protein-like protein 3 [Diplonema papillatum]|nr:Polypyrimidine tract-binding protein-like protein 3 [Diplonema papillatum]